MVWIMKKVEFKLLLAGCLLKKGGIWLYTIPGPTVPKQPAANSLSKAGTEEILGGGWHYRQSLLYVLILNMTTKKSRVLF